MTVATFQPPDSGGGAGLDTGLNKFAPTSNFGTVAAFDLGVVDFKGAAQPYHAIIEIDISSIPAGATVSAAQWDWYGAASVAIDCVFYRLRRTDWSETQATWNIYKTSNNWTTAGGTDTTNDIDTTNAPTFTMPAAAGAFSIATSAAFVAMVQDALDTRSGILRCLFKAVNDASLVGTKSIDSAEGTTASRRPKLTVTYTEASTRRIFLC